MPAAPAEGTAYRWGAIHPFHPFPQSPWPGPFLGPSFLAAGQLVVLANALPTDTTWGAFTTGQFVVDPALHAPVPTTAPTEVLPYEITEGAFATSTNGKGYYFGGVEESLTHYQRTDAIREIDPLTGEIGTIARLPHKSVYPAAARLGSSIFIIGGDRIGGSALEIWEYFPSSNLIATRAETMPFRTTAPATISVGGSIYIFGGGGQEHALKLLKFTPGVGVAELSTRLPERVLGGVPGWDGENVYLFGGNGDSSDSLFRIQRFNPLTESIELLPEVLPAGVFTGSASWTGNQFLITTPNSRDILAYDPSARSVSVLAVPIDAGSVDVPVSVRVHGRMVGGEYWLDITGAPRLRFNTLGAQLPTVDHETPARVGGALGGLTVTAYPDPGSSTFVAAIGDDEVCAPDARHATSQGFTVELTTSFGSYTIWGPAAGALLNAEGGC